MDVCLRCPLDLAEKTPSAELNTLNCFASASKDVSYLLLPQMPANKNKRGDRGSTEEDTRASKKSNMAAANRSTGIKDAIEQLSDQEEPSLLEIKEILIAIKCLISSVFEENKALRKEIKELKSNVNFNDKGLKDLKALLQKSKKEFVNIDKWAT